MDEGQPGSPAEVARDVGRHLVKSLLRRLAVALSLPLTLSPHAMAQASEGERLVLVADRVFDGQQLHESWSVALRGSEIVEVGPSATVDTYDAKVLRLPGATLLPGLIEGHAHLLLHPYDETPWNDQVLRESQAERVARATVHARETLLAGFTTLRDLGSEGASYADVGLREAIEKGVVPGPHLLVAGPAIVATGSYGPKGFHAGVRLPLGAEQADGRDDLIRVARDQIGKGADVVKVYADYRWGPSGEARPTFTQAELELVVEVATSSGRPVVAHAATPEGMRRATLAGVETIEHGDGATREVLELMAGRGVALCPTLAAVEAIERYRGWDGNAPEPERIRNKRALIATALEVGVPLCAGSDAGVFRHGDNAWELELMVAYGVPTLDVLRAATSGNAELFHLPDRGRLEPGQLADLVAVRGDPSQNVSALRDVVLVAKGGEIVVGPAD